MSACKHLVVEGVGSAWKCAHCPKTFMPAGETDASDYTHMTLGALEALAERYGKAVATIKEAQALFGPGPAQALLPVQMAMRHPNGATVQVAPAPGSPFPCPACGRTATEKPGEPTQPQECLQCGNHLPLPQGAPGLRMSNKGPLVMDATMLAERQRLVTQPAFDENGEPIS